MTVSTLDQKTALIVIDLQKGVLSIPSAHPVEAVVANSVALVESFRRHALPVVLVTVTGAPSGRTEQARGGAGLERPADWADLIPELVQRPDDHFITKRTWGAFTNTGLDEHLKSLGVTQVVIAGIATSAGVESTARHAHENGFNVTLAIDAMTDRNPEAHDHSVAHIFPRLGETGTTQEILDLLDGTRR